MRVLLVISVRERAREGRHYISRVGGVLHQGLLCQWFATPSLPVAQAPGTREGRHYISDDPIREM